MAKTLTQVGIETGNLVEAYHVTQSIDAFTGTDAYDISLSGSFNMTGSINGEPSVINPLTASYAMNALSSSKSLVLSGSFAGLTYLYGGLEGSNSPGTARALNSTNLTYNTTTRLLNASSSFAITASHVISASYAVTASHVISASYAVTASHVISASYALSASHAPNFATTDLTFSGNRTHNTSGNTLTITDGTNDRFEILTTSTVFNDSGADIDFRVESLDNANALLVDAFTNQVRIGVTGSKSAPSLYFGSDNNTGFYNSGSNNTLYITANSTDVARISPQQLIVGDQDFKSNINYAQSGVLTQGYLYSLEGLSSNIFYHPSNFFARGKANLGGFSITYVPTSSIVDPADGEKVIFRTMPSGSTTGIAVTSSAALRIDVNYIDGVDNEPNIEIVNRLTLGTLWSGTNTGIGRDSSTGQITAVSSDQRLKTNIQTLTGSLNKIKALRGTQFEWTNENDPEFRIGNDAFGTQIGLIAQEVEQILPEVVKPNGVKDYKSVEYDKIVAVLIEAVKEQQQQIDNLQQQIDSLKS
jgi:hypothetical protein